MSDARSASVAVLKQVEHGNANRALSKAFSVAVIILLLAWWVDY